MLKKNVLMSIMSFFLTGALLSSKDPKEAILLVPPHPDRVNQNGRVIIDPVTPPNRSPRNMRKHEKAVYVMKQRKKRLHA